jgi:hypothetical protein
MSSVLRWATIFGLLLGAGLFGLSCRGGGGGDPLTLEEFFTELEALDAKFETDSNEIDAQSEGLSDEELLAQAPELFQEQADLVTEFVDGIEDLEAPDEAADLQEEAVSAGRAAVDSLEEALNESADAETLDEFFAVFEENTEFTAAVDRFDQVCLDAEALATENDITVDLNCEE